MDRLARSRDALADHIDAAERMGGDSRPPCDDAGLEPVPARATGMPDTCGRTGGVRAMTGKGLPPESLSVACPRVPGS
jgi:hypothetical protein